MTNEGVYINHKDHRLTIKRSGLERTGSVSPKVNMTIHFRTARRAECWMSPEESFELGLLLLQMRVDGHIRIDNRTYSFPEFVFSGDDTGFCIMRPVPARAFTPPREGEDSYIAASMGLDREQVETIGHELCRMGMMNET